MATAIDTLAYTKRLLEVGFSNEQAEAQAQALNEAMENNLATKSDLKDLHNEIIAVRKDLRNEIGMLDTKVDNKINRLEIKMLGAIIGCTGIIIASIKYLIT